MLANCSIIKDFNNNFPSFIKSFISVSVSQSLVQNIVHQSFLNIFRNMKFYKIVLWFAIFALSTESMNQSEYLSETIMLDNESNIFDQNDPFNIGSKLIKSDIVLMFVEQNLTKECQRDVNYFAESLQKLKLWSLKSNYLFTRFEFPIIIRKILVYDANPKWPSGILNGNLNQYGDFDQCLSIVAETGNFQGQYCLASIQVSLPKQFKNLTFLRKLALATEPYLSNLEDVSVELRVDKTN